MHCNKRPIDPKKSMYIDNAIRSAPQPQLASLLTLLQQRFSAWRHFAATSASARHHTSDDAQTLYARAAHYEATQPGFAADLRAAADAMARVDDPQTR